MHMRRFVVAITLATSLACSLVVGVVSPASASPRLPHAVTIGGKNTLPESSYGSPGFASRAGRTVLAWTGTDAAHHLNVEISANGLTGYGSKIILGDTSIGGPAVAQMSESAGNAVILAWTGTDASHRLNILFDAYGQRHKVTFNETSFTSPGLTIFNGDLYLAWAGTDPRHTLNVATISLSSLAEVGKLTFIGTSTNEGPTLATITIEPSLKEGGTERTEASLTWTDSNNHLTFSNSASGLEFMEPLARPETSPFAPSQMEFSTEGGPPIWIAWTGSDAGRHLSVKSTTFAAYPAFVGATTTLNETAFGHPGIGFNNVVFIAWTGTDAAHHLNVVRIEGS